MNATEAAKTQSFFREVNERMRERTNPSTRWAAVRISYASAPERAVRIPSR